ncbi:MAG: glycosyltransferase family 4 protein [Planctomycetales bacterium]|nr:glycosyltransferase family 4 protein [Planctomycetales bacterium]
MKILFLSHYFPPEGNAPANRTYENCLRWVQAGHQVTVVTCVPNVPDGIPYDGYRNRLLPQKETIDGIRVVRVWTWLAPNAGTIRRILNYLSYLFSSVLATLFLRRPEVVIATSPQFFCGWAGTLASWLKWRPFVLEIRDIWPESILTVGAMNKGRLISLLEVLEKWMYRSATHIVAVGDGYRDNIRHKVDMADRISVIPNGVDLEVFHPRPRSAEFREAWGLGDRFVCSYVGTIGMAHGLEVVVRTANRFRAAGRNDVVFLLVGDGADRGALEQQVDAEGLQEYVRFTGRLPRDQMPVVLANSDASLVHLRAMELFATVIPSKIFETMAMGCPIIMGVKGLALDIVREARAGVALEPEDDNGLCSILERMISEPDWLATFAEEGRRYVAQHYNRDELASQYLELLEGLTEGRLLSAPSNAAATTPPE